MGTFGQEVIAGAVGGAVGGLAMSGIRAVSDAAGFSGDSPPLKFHRRFEVAAGFDVPRGAGREGAVVLGEHLLLSAGLGALYGAVHAAARPRRGVAGPAYGAGVYGVMLGLVGPAVGAVRPPRREPARHRAQRWATHLVYGTVTAWVADRVLARLERR